MFLRILISFAILVFAKCCYAQELANNLFYANENLKFEKLYILGDYKLLYYADQRRQNKRFVYLLNKENAVSDVMKVEGNDYLLIRSDSTFSIKGLGDLFDMKITADQFQTTLAIDVSAAFSLEYFEPAYIINEYFIGNKYHPKDDYLSYHYLRLDSLEVLSATPIKTENYNIDDSTAVFLLNEKVYRKLEGKTYENLPIRSLIHKENTMKQRIQYPYYGWLSSSLDENVYTFYERKAGKIFSIDVSAEPKPISEIMLPIGDRRKEGWKYLFDFKQKRHYAVKRINTTLIPEGLKKRKADKIKKTYEYQLYQLLQESGTFVLKPLYKLAFDPILIDDELIYEIVQESKKGSAIFFHPLDANYVYKKRKVIYSGN